MPDLPADINDAVRALLAEFDKLQQERFAAQDISREALRELLNQRFKDMESAAFALLDSIKTAIVKQEAAYDRRFEQVNEFRKSLSDLSSDMMPRLEAEQRWRDAHARLEKIEAFQEMRRGVMTVEERHAAAMRTLTMWMIGTVAAVMLGIIGIIVSVWIRGK